MKPVHVLVLSGFGLNCDHETLYAFELAGAAATRVHINSLIDGSSRLEDFDILVFIGGFSWGDDHGAGVIQAVRMKSTLGEKLIGFVAAGKLILGICNGFQTLVNLGLLPGFDHDYRRRCVALIHNDCGNFRNQWVHLMVNSASPCVFTRGLQQLDLPVRHGEGKFFAEPATISRLAESNQVVIRYADAQGRPAQARFPDNPNGSEDDIAGICDPTGRIFGLMPHPEAYNHWTNHPDWTRHRESWIRQGKTTGPRPTPGIQLLQNAVSYIRES
jgi:phosphoribosylformylglycinamidine synthase subunit PurQ / glutaminase